MAIRLVGEVNEEMYKKLSRAIDALECGESDETAIELVSEGGSAYDALAIAGRMRDSSFKFTVTAYGKCMSAAIIILAAAHTRRASETTWFMVHEDAGEQTGNTAAIMACADQMQAEEDHWNELLEKYTGTSALEWARLASNETYFTATTAKKLNLVHEIV